MKKKLQNREKGNPIDSGLWNWLCVYKSPLINDLYNILKMLKKKPINIIF